MFGYNMEHQRAIGRTASASPSSAAEHSYSYPGTRMLEDVEAPETRIPLRSEIWTDGGKKLNLPLLREHFRREGRLSPADAIEICHRVATLLRKQPNVLTLQDPITVCGDIHGQYYDLLKLLDIGGDPASTQYLFLGDYVDRGYFGCECALYLFAMKLNHPNQVHLLRGNHECRHLTAFFNFKAECLYKYSEDVYDAVMDAFDALSLAAILNGRFFCVHGGLSPDVKTVEDIQRINRFSEPPSSGAFCDLLWSDPMDEDDESQNPNVLFLSNELRGCSYVYSYAAVCAFLQNNNFLSVIRAHEAQDNGYRLYRKTTSNDFPSVICIFSAPNYCDVYNNKGAVIRFQNNLMNIRQFNYSPHPYWLPNFMNAFNWSLPFVAEKIAEMLTSILNVCTEADLVDSDEEEEVVQATPAAPASRSEILRNKVRAVARMQSMFKTIREETDSVVFLKGLVGSGKLPPGLLSMGSRKLREVVKDFNSVKELDRPNETFPTDDGRPIVMPTVFRQVQDQTKQRVMEFSERLKGEGVTNLCIEGSDDGTSNASTSARRSISPAHSRGRSGSNSSVSSGDGGSARRRV